VTLIFDLPKEWRSRDCQVVITYQECVQQLTGPRFWAIFLDRSAVAQLSAKRPGHLSWIDF